MPLKISIITPSYNQAAYLERTLRSVRDQRDLVHEHFVLDGGSTDGSTGIIERHAGSIDWWTSQRDGGQAEAIHRGFERATGDVLYWLNSDDVLLPGALERVHAAFRRRPDLEVLTGWGVAIDGNDRVLEVRRGPHDAPWRARLGYVRVIQPCCFFRRELYRSVGGLDHDLDCVLDTDLWYRMLRATPRWGGANAYLAAYRLHPQAKGSTMKDRYAEERTLMRQRYPELTVRGPRHGLGSIAYLASQWWSGRGLAEARDGRRWRRRRLAEIQTQARHPV